MPAIEMLPAALVQPHMAAPLAPPARSLVTLATYNEIENLPALVAEILRCVPEADILVVDDNSPDGTGRWCDERGHDEPRLHCLHRPGKLGLGTATIAALQYGLAHGYGYVINMDADFSHPPTKLPELIACLETNDQVDVAIGSRYVPGGGIEGWPLRRHLMSRLVNALARGALRLPVRDTSGAFRAYRTDLLRRVDLTQVRSRGYSFEEEILWLIKRAGARFQEIPITFVDRRFGQSKINLREAFAALGMILRLGVREWCGGRSAPRAFQETNGPAVR
jgi:dolichol-phosphate mannosyltransferase